MPFASTSSSRQQAFAPRVRLFVEHLLVDRAEGLAPQYDEVSAPAIELSFDYGGRIVPASEPGDRFFVVHGARMMPVARDREGESRARYLLESMGAVELACLERYVVAPGSRADYVVELEGDTHAICAFGAYAVPQLRRLGWTVEIDDDYPWQVVEPRWYADLSDSDEDDWFSLELGVELEGARVSLLPALVELLQRSSSLKGLLDRPRRCVALPLDDRRYVPVPAERLRTLIDVLVELYDPRQQKLSSLSSQRLELLARLDRAFEQGREIRWRGGDAARARARSLVEGPVRRCRPPEGLQATLRSYQQRGVDWLQHLRDHGAGGILADDMGLGKTLQTITHLLAEHTRNGARSPSLVVAPTSLVGNWQRELARFAPSLWVTVLHGKRRFERFAELERCDVAITSYPLLVRDAERLGQHRFHYAVFDEAQVLKNPRSQAHRAACELPATHRLCLSGTPLENHLGELWSLFELLMPGALGDAGRFRELYRQPIERDGHEERLEALRQRVAPFILRRTKEEVAPELPAKTEMVRPVELRGAQRELYESIRIAAHRRVRDTIARLGISGSTIAILDALMKLRQVCCDPRLLRSAAAERVEESAKLELAFELLEQQLAEGRRVLLFSQFTSMLKIIAAGLRERSIAYVSLTGSTGDRQRPVRAFERRMVDVFLISLKAGGTGLNLTSADTVIHYDPWWNPAAQAQATDRAHRIGQTRPVFVYNLIVAGSVEERMLQLQRHKRDLANSILASGPEGRLSRRDIDNLFAPLD